MAPSAAAHRLKLALPQAATHARDSALSDPEHDRWNEIRNRLGDYERVRLSDQPLVDVFLEKELPRWRASRRTRPLVYQTALGFIDECQSCQPFHNRLQNLPPGFVPTTFFPHPNKSLLDLVWRSSSPRLRLSNAASNRHSVSAKFSTKVTEFLSSGIHESVSMSQPA